MQRACRAAALILVAVLALGCATQRPPAPLPEMAVVCPEIPLPPKPDIAIPKPQACYPRAGEVYCFSEWEMLVIQDYAKTLRTLIETYNAECSRAR